MITNLETIENKFMCNNVVARYLVLECDLPVLGYDKEHYFYFANTDKLKECVSKMPLTVKIHSTFDELIYIIKDSSKGRR
jgi:hypothetical protein